MIYKPIRYRDFATEARERSGMTQLQIAQALGISRSSWQKYEYGLRRPRSGKLREDMYKLLGIPVEAWDEAEDTYRHPQDGGQRSA